MPSWQRQALFLVALSSMLTFVSIEAAAEVPLMTDDNRESEATVVAQVEVLSVGTVKKKVGGFLRLHHAIKAKVLSVKKNASKVKIGQVITVRAWSQRWQGPGAAPPHSSGHALKAKAGERYTLYLETAKDGGLDVLLPNGFEPIRNQ